MTLGIREFGSSDMIRDMEHIAQLIRVSSLHPERIVGQGDQFLAVIIAGLGVARVGGGKVTWRVPFSCLLIHFPNGGTIEGWRSYGTSRVPKSWKQDR